MFVVLAIGLTAVADDKEKKYTSKESGFAIQFPAGAKVMTKDQEAPNGIVIKGTSLELDMKVYGVIAMTFPAGALQALPTKDHLDNGEQGAVTQNGGKKVSAKDLEFGTEKFPGREIVVEKDGMFIRTQIVFADPKMYFLTVAGPRDFATGKEGTDFLKSFEILKLAKPEK